MQQLTGPAGFTRALLEQGRRLPVSLPLARTPSSREPARMRWIASAVRKDTLYWLFRQGGWRSQHVVTGGRRREGRVWGPGIYEALDMRFSPASLHLLAAAMQEADPDRPPLLARAADLEALSAGLVEDAPATGDLLALHRLVELLAGRQLDADPCFPLVYGEDGRGVPGMPGLERDLRQLEDRVHRSTGLALLARDGWVLGLSPQARERAKVARLLRGFLRASGKPRNGGWIDLGTGRKSGERVLLRPWKQGPPVLLACWLQPRTRKVNLTEPGIRDAVLGLPRHWQEGAGEALEAPSRARSLLRLSPLTLAFRPQGNGGLDGLLSTLEGAAERLRPLFLGDRATLTRYLDEPLARAWLGEEIARRRLPAPQAHAAYLAGVRGLRAYVDASRARPDALRPVMLFLGLYLRRFGTRTPVVQALREQAHGFDRASQRDALLLAASELFGVGRAVQAATQEALSVAFVDRSEPQKLLLADYHTLYKDIEDEVEAIRRELAGEIG